MNPRTLGPLFIILLSLSACLASGCAHLSQDLAPENVSPFFHIQTDPEKKVRRLDAAGPFYSQTETPEEKEWTFRPLFSYREDLKNQTDELEFLYPLGRVRKTPEYRLVRFIPFFTSYKSLNEEEGEKEQTDLILLFWGKNSQGEAYGGFFPFGGQFKGRFARDEIAFVLWPLYTHIREGETHTHHLLWPVFSWTEGGDRKGFRIWPFYGHEEQQGQGAFQKTFFLWPIGHYQKEYLDTDHPKTSFYLFPFYLSEESPNEKKVILLWPFFNYYSEKNFDYVQWDLPWPFFQYARGEKTLALNLWPLVTYRKVEAREKLSLFWFLYRLEREEDEERDEVLNRFLMITKVHQVYWKKEDRWERVTKIWPLFRYAEDGRGMVHFYFPDLMPVDWEGFERHYGLLFRLYEYYQDGRGKEVSKFLWGLYYHRKEKESRRIEVGFLFSYFSEKETLEFSLLKGLLGYRREGLKRRWRIFYIPTSWETVEESAKPIPSPGAG